MVKGMNRNPLRADEGAKADIESRLDKSNLCGIQRIWNLKPHHGVISKLE